MFGHSAESFLIMQWLSKNITNTNIKTFFQSLNSGMAIDCVHSLRPWMEYKALLFYHFPSAYLRPSFEELQVGLNNKDKDIIYIQLLETKMPQNQQKEKAYFNITTT